MRLVGEIQVERKIDLPTEKCDPRMFLMLACSCAFLFPAKFELRGTNWLYVEDRLFPSTREREKEVRT